MDGNRAHCQIHKICLVEVDEARHDCEEDGHDKSGSCPADVLKRAAFLSYDSLDVFGVLFLLLRDSAKLCKCVEQVHVAHVEGLVRDGGLEKPSERLLHVLQQLLFHVFVALVSEDLKPQVQQNVFQQFYFRVDPLKRDSDLPGAWGLQSVQFVFLHLVNVGRVRCGVVNHIYVKVPRLHPLEQS